MRPAKYIKLGKFLLLKIIFFIMKMLLVKNFLINLVIFFPEYSKTDGNTRIPGPGAFVRPLGPSNSNRPSLSTTKPQNNAGKNKQSSFVPIRHVVRAETPPTKQTVATSMVPIRHVVPQSVPSFVFMQPRIMTTSVVPIRHVTTVGSFPIITAAPSFVNVQPRLVTTSVASMVSICHVTTVGSHPIITAAPSFVNVQPRIMTPSMVPIRHVVRPETPPIQANMTSMRHVVRTKTPPVITTAQPFVAIRHLVRPETPPIQTKVASNLPIRNVTTEPPRSASSCVSAQPSIMTTSVSSMVSIRNITTETPPIKTTAPSMDSTNMTQVISSSQSCSEIESSQFNQMDDTEEYSMEDVRRSHKRPFSTKEINSNTEQEINDMNEKVQECIMQQQKNNVRFVTRENCGIFDVYQLVKTLLLICKRLERGLLDTGNNGEDMPFSFPLKSKEDIKKCEEYISEDSAYIKLVRFYLIFLKIKSKNQFLHPLSVHLSSLISFLKQQISLVPLKSSPHPVFLRIYSKKVLFFRKFPINNFNNIILHYTKSSSKLTSSKINTKVIISITKDTNKL